MKKLQEYLRDFADDTAGSVEFRNDYSGRCMYGNRCVALTGSWDDIRRLMAYLIMELLDDLGRGGTGDPKDLVEPYKDYAQALMNYSQDNMGLDIVVYWPSLKPLPEQMEG